jgi:hypothetical protein
MFYQTPDFDCSRFRPFVQRSRRTLRHQRRAQRRRPLDVGVRVHGLSGTAQWRSAVQLHE